MEAIDLTPTWAAVLPILLAAVEDGTAEGRKIAREELARMAGFADKYVELSKKAKCPICHSNSRPGDCSCPCQMGGGLYD